MIRNKLPTFHKWGKKLLEYRRAIFIALLVLGGREVACIYLKQYYAVILPCDQPCQDAVSCDPLEFAFEVAPTKIKLGQPYYLWYRAKLKNRSCRRLEGIYVDGLVDSKELRKSNMGLWVAAAGPDGREVERLPIPGPDGGISWNYGNAKGIAISTEGVIYPYQPNFEFIGKLRASKKLDGDFVDLEPGETFETITPVLRPYRIVATSFRTEDGGIGDGYRWVKVENPPKFPTPPEGFNFLDRYAFARPGRYTIKAGFVDKLHVYRVFSRWENRPRWIKWLFWDTYPAQKWESEERDVNMVAPPATVEVSR
jgi:hypothetical protein